MLNVVGCGATSHKSLSEDSSSFGKTHLKSSQHNICINGALKKLWHVVRALSRPHDQSFHSVE